MPSYALEEPGLDPEGTGSLGKDFKQKRDVVRLVF